MKITIVTPLFPPEIGGPATYVVPLALGLKKKGHTVKILTLAFDHPKEKYGLEVLSIIREGEVLNELRLFKELMIHGHDSDLIYGLDIAAIGMQCIIAGRILNKPVAIRYAGDTAWEKSRRMEITDMELEPFLKKPNVNLSIFFIQKKVLQGASVVITPSKYLKRVIHDCYEIDEAKIFSINNAIHAPDNDVVESDSYIAYGRYVPWKRFDRIIEAFSKMPERQLLIVGEGPFWARYCLQAKPYKNIQVVQKMSNNLLMNILTCSKAFILNSSYEGMSHSILEAFAMKTPVIASDIEPNKELIVDGETGELIPSEPHDANVNAIIEAVKKMDDARFANKLIINGYKKVSTEHTWEHNIDETEKIFKSVVK